MVTSDIYERFYVFRALSIIGKCTSRHLFVHGGLCSVYDLLLAKIYFSTSENANKYFFFVISCSDG